MTPGEPPPALLVTPAGTRFLNLDGGALTREATIDLIQALVASLPPEPDGG